ncbi:hypothetical protein EK904_014332 [Melospiza melodia maxima]|nr:hypothetical protein EK904_014332 [Melospiza melodia maxima]
MKLHGYQEPTPPPRPLKMLPKQYQPLPPEPRISSQVLPKRNTLSRDPTFPISAEVTRAAQIESFLRNVIIHAASRYQYAEHLDLKDIVLLGNQIQYLEDSKLQVWGRNLKYLFKHNIILLKPGSTLSVDNLTVKKPPPPTSYAACKNKSKHLLVEQEMQSLTKPTEKDETFLVRDCSKKSKAEPYVLVVYYGRRVYNIKVRFLEESQQYALGTGLRGECKFNSVEEIIDFYRSVPITLIDGKDQSGNHREQCYLTHPFKAC